MSNNIEDYPKVNNLKFGLKNFKSFKSPCSIDVKPLTIICGVNNCGKSSLIQSLLLLSQTLNEWEKFSRLPIFQMGVPILKEEKRYKTNLLFEGNLCHLGHFNNILNIYSEKKELKFNFDIKDIFRLSITFFNPFIEKMIKAFVKEFEVKGKGYDFKVVSNMDDKLNIQNYSCEIKKMNIQSLLEHCPLIRNSSIEQTYKKIFEASLLENYVIENIHVYFNGFIPESLVIPINFFFKEIENIFKEIIKDENQLRDITRMFQEELGFFSEREREKVNEKYEKCFILFEFSESDIIKDLFKRIHYIGPLREAPRRYYQFSDIRELSIGNKGEFAPQILTLYSTSEIPKFKIYSVKNEELEFKTVEDNNLTLIDGLSKWGEVLDLPVISPKRLEQILTKILIKLPNTKESITLQDVGFGISQILPIFIESLRMDSGDTLVLEQPEIHLHPSMQSKLGDFLLSMALSNKNFIIETHSEHLINRLCLRIAQDQTNTLKNLVSIVFIEPFNRGEKGQSQGSKITKVALSKFGEILNWPVGFFDGSDHHEILRAGILKRKRESELKGE